MPWWVYLIIISGVLAALTAFRIVKQVRDNLDRFRIFLPTLFFFGRGLVVWLIVTAAAFGLCVGFGVFSLAVRSFSFGLLPPLVLFAAAIVMTVRASVNFAAPCYYAYRVFEHDEEITTRGRVITYEGGPGSGKTLSMTYDGVAVARYAWGELLFDQLYNDAVARYTGLTEDTEQVRRIIDEAVALYSGSNAIPLLYSNYPIEVDGKYSSKLSFAHFLQAKRLPERAVILDDESAEDLSNRRSVAVDDETEAENAKLSKLFSKVRHYGDWHLFCAEQDGKENFNGLRRVTATNRYLYGLEKVCTPDRLIRRLEKYKLKAFARGECVEKLYVKMRRLKERISKIGFFRLSYYDIPTYGKDAHVDIKQGVYFLPINLPFKYDSRAYRFEYAALAQSLELDVFNSLYVDAKLPTTEAAVKALQDRARAAYLALQAEERLYKTAELRGRVKELRKKYPAIYAQYCGTKSPPSGDTSASA